MTLLWVTGGVVGAALLGVYLPWTAWVLPVGLAAFGLGLALCLGKKWPPARRVLLGAGIALLWLTGYGAIVQAPAEALAYRTVEMEAVVTQWPEETDYGARVQIKGGEVGERKVNALFYGEEDLLTLRPGDRIATIAYCTPANRIAGEESLYYAGQGILLQMEGHGEITFIRQEGLSLRYGLTILAGKVMDQIDQLYPEREAGFLRALLMGDKTGLEDVDQNHFNRVGLGHVVVISGFHVSVLVGFLTLFLNPKRKGHVAAIFLVLLAFCLMTGSDPGTVRAAVLCALAMTAPLLGRSYDSLTGLCAALLLLLAVNPYAVANAGLQFSFLSTLGILTFGQRWNKAWLAGVPKKGKRWAAPWIGCAAISLSAMVFTVPLSGLYFGRFSLIAPLANLCTEWAVILAFVGGAVSVLAGAVFLPLGQALAALVALPVDYFYWFSQQASGLGLASVDLDRGYYALWSLFAYGILILCLAWPGKGKRPILPVCACAVTLCLSALLTTKTVQRHDLTFTLLDVGQGQCAVVTSGNARAMVDCGGTRDPGDNGATYLQSIGSSRLDLLVLTHFHEDHAGGVLELMDRVKVGAIAAPDVDRDSALRQAIEARAAEEGVPIHYITENTLVTLGRAQLTLYSPVEGGGDSNEQCLSVLCAANGWEALLTGDMPLEGEARLAAREDLPQVEVLVAGHHGSKYATGEVLLEETDPEVVAISVGYNSYGHPAPEMLARVRAQGAELYRTDYHGGITFTAPDGEGS